MRVKKLEGEDLSDTLTKKNRMFIFQSSQIA